MFLCVYLCVLFRSRIFILTVEYYLLAEYDTARHNRNVHVIAGTVTGISAFGAVGIGGFIWYIKKVRAKAPVTCGVETNENRLF